ncbi:MAG TPA: hypothetical protein VH110_01285, partial [Candidatus Acidoferrum sp.]|nr:hypothetical protein [Candidatus Acidoferrum sp.]
VVFNLELTNVALELAQLFVHGRHEWKETSAYYAKRTKPSRQPGSGVPCAFATLLEFECLAFRPVPSPNALIRTDPGIPVLSFVSVVC